MEKAAQNRRNDNKNNTIYYEENIPTLAEKKSQQARFPQENVHRQR